MVEEWRPIAGFPDYAVSSLGRVRRIRPDALGRTLSDILQPVARADGYFAYSLHNCGTQKVVLAHRVVCEAFHGPAPIGGRPHAAHGDGDKSHNAADNLRWASPSDNNLDKHRHGTMRVGDRHHARAKPECMPRGETHGNAKLNEYSIRSIRSDGRSQKLIAQEFGVCQSLISQIKLGKIWSHIT